MRQRVRIAALATFLVAIAWSTHADAQLVEADTIYFTTEKKQPGHIFFGMGSDYCYGVNGVAGGTIAIIRGKRYAWNVREVPGSGVPAIFTQPAGVSTGKYHYLWDGEDLQNFLRFVRADRDDPDTLYYGGLDSLYFGGLILVVDSLTTSVSSDERDRTLGSASVTVTPNPVISSALFRMSMSVVEPCRLEIVDLTGRLVRTEGAPTTPAGRTSTIPFDRGDLPSATYVWRLVRTRDGVPLSSGTMTVR